MGDLVLWSCRQKEGRERKEWMLGNISHYVRGQRFPSVQNQQITYILSKSIVVSPTDRDNGKGRRRENLAVIPSPTPRLV